MDYSKIPNGRLPHSFSATFKNGEAIKTINSIKNNNNIKQKPLDKPADDSIEGLNYLHDHYCTLKDVFLLAPKELGFNIEIKYPNEKECIEDGIE